MLRHGMTQRVDTMDIKFDNGQATVVR